MRKLFNYWSLKMKKIMTVCSTGLGSSFLVEMNIQEILRDLGWDDEFETCHCAVYEMNCTDAEYFVIPKDLEGSISNVDNLVVLESLIDLDELKEKLIKVILGNTE